VNVFLTIANRANRDKLQTQLSQLDTYEFTTGDSPTTTDTDVDLWIIDGPTLERELEAIRETKAAHEPRYFPILLICPEAKRSALSTTVWEYVDDVVTIPVTPAVLDVRIKNLLRTRALSLQAISSQQRFDSLVRTTSSGVIFLTGDGTISFANSAIETLFGYSSHELIGNPVTMLIPPRIQPAAEDGLENYDTEQSTTGATLESIAQHKDGREIPIQLSYGWFELDGTIFITGIVQEMTEIKKRETRLQVLNRVLRHDIRNDMNVIQGYAELIADNPTDADQYIGTILAVIDDVVKLSEQARDLDQLFDSSHETRTTIDSCTLVQSKVEEFSAVYPNATVEAAFPDGTNVSVIAIDLLDSVVDNLIENAIKHNDSETPEVTVTVRADADTVKIAVVDNGPGLPDHDVAVVETGTETPLEHASGLGLWLVNWIVTESGGRIRFSEAEPRGSCITIELPAG